MDWLKTPYCILVKFLNKLAPFFDLGARLWVAKVFWDSGMTKIQSWESTLMLFQYEYQVPLLPYEVAAYLGTMIELVMPIMLLFGLLSRFAALILFIFNLVAMISYPDISIAGVHQHYFWGALIAVIVFHGPGKLSLDCYLGQKLK